MKLLRTFKNINELNVIKMVDENPEFIFPANASLAQLRNISMANLAQQS
jgi:hypothetical protein